MLKQFCREFSRTYVAYNAREIYNQNRFSNVELNQILENLKNAIDNKNKSDIVECFEYIAYRTIKHYMTEKQILKVNKALGYLSNIIDSDNKYIYDSIDDVGLVSLFTVLSNSIYTMKLENDFNIKEILILCFSALNYLTKNNYML